MERCKFARGFTLLEVMVGLVLAAVIASMAVPAFQSLIVSTRTDTRAANWIAVLNLLRSEAIKRNQQVSLCPSVSGVSCDYQLNWRDGWIMFTDANRSGDIEPATEQILAVGEALADGDVLLATKHKDWFGYRGDGAAVGNSGSGNTTFLFCKPGAEDNLARRVVVSVTGRPRIEAGLGGKACI